MDQTPSFRVRTTPRPAIALLITLLGLLGGPQLRGQTVGPDLEGALGVVTSAEEEAGSGPTASFLIHHGYPLFQRVYLRLGLGANYRNFVSTDAESLYVNGDPRLLRRRLDLREAHGVAALGVGAEFGKYVLEAGISYLRLLWADATLTTATYGGQGEEIVAPATSKLLYRAVTPGPGIGEYYTTRHTDWIGSVGIYRRLLHNVTFGLRYSHHLARPMLVHSNEFICSEPTGCLTEPTFRRQLAFPAAAVTVALRYRLSSR